MRILRSALVVAAIPFVAVSSSSTASAPVRPNIVFLFSDDHAAHAISAYQQSLKYGVKLPPTPNLDRLAHDGMLFVNSFVTNSICGPARATVLTGQYGHLNGVMSNNEAIHPATVTFPKLMHASVPRSIRLDCPRTRSSSIRRIRVSSPATMDGSTGDGCTRSLCARRSSGNGREW